MKERGFTLIELLVVLSIISLLSSVVMSSLNTARAKSRYANIIGQMRQIQIASLAYLTDTGTNAPDTGPGGAPAFVPTYLVAWPKPPCGPTWSYDWDNWTTGTGFIGVHLYSSVTGANYSYCTDINSVCTGTGAPNIRTISPKAITCN